MLQTFETEMLAEEVNFAGLARINRELIGKVEALDSAQRVVLDMDSTARVTVWRPSCGPAMSIAPRTGTDSRAVVRFYNKHGRAVDQGRQAGGEDDAAELPPVPLQ